MSRRLAIGLMSGTSMDGVDAALIETDGIEVFATGPALTRPYAPEFRSSLRSLLGGAPAERIAPVAAALTEAHAEAVGALLAAAGLPASAIAVLGFHGHTIDHRPRDGVTVQIGDGAMLARATGIDTVADFRTADVAAGGEGAPLVPVYHQALARGLARPLAILNLGGVGNVTWIGNDGLLAFDTGPGCALLDDFVLRRTEQAYDADGRLAAAGRVEESVVASLLADPYFARRPPKSLDRDHFRRIGADHLGDADGAATLAEATAASVAAALAHFPATPGRWIVTGGGRRHPAILAALRRRLAVPVETTEQLGWDGDALEAQAFGFLAVRSLEGLPLSFPATTGVGRPMTGGRLFCSR